MANGNGGLTKADLQDQLDQIEKILSDAYQVEADRESLAGAIGDALAVIEGDGDEDEDDDQDDDDQGN